MPCVLLEPRARKVMTPRQIVDLIGNIGNRPDIEAVRLRMLECIEQLVREARAEGVRWAADHIDDGAEGVGHYYAEQIRRNVPDGEDSKDG